jgi:hypothetical protein
VAAIDAPAFVTAGNRLVLLPGEGVASKDPLDWQVIAPANAPFRVEGRALIVRDPVPGTVYRFVQIASGDRPAFRFAFADVPVLAPPAPVPVPTPTPTPAPTPAPVDPPAPPDEVPSVVGNMRVVILFESSAKLTPGQHDAIWSTKKVLPYLNSHCMKSATGRPEWRAWDQNIDITNEPREWQVAALAALQAPPIALPKAVVFAGSQVVAVHPITTEDDLLAFLQSKGGK